MVTAQGLYWTADFGEIAEAKQFRVGSVGEEIYDAYFPINQLQDLITSLTNVTPLGLNELSLGTQVQSKKVNAGFHTDVVIEPRLNAFPPPIMRFELTALADLISVLTSLQTLIAGQEPSDWNNDSKYTFPPSSLPAYLQPAQLTATIDDAIAASGTGGASEAQSISQIEAVLRARYYADQENIAGGIVGTAISNLDDSLTRGPFETSLGVSTVAAGTPDLVTTPSAHGLKIGDRVRFHTKTGFNGSQGSLTSAFVSSVPSGVTFSVFASGNSGGEADLTSSSGSATVMKNAPYNYWTWEVSAGSITGDATGDVAGDDMLICATPHMLMVGDQVSFGSSTIAGIASDTRYWVKDRISDYKFRVAPTRAQSSVVDITGDGTATLRRAGARLSRYRWPLIQKHLTTYPASFVAAADTGMTSVGTGTVNSGVPIVRIVVTSKTLGFILYRSGASNLKIYVDGALHRSITEADMASGGLSTGGLGWYGMTFPDTRPREITIFGADIAAVATATDADLAASPTPHGIRIVTPGDSFTEGTGATEPEKGFANLASRFGTQLGEIIPMGSGSTGYNAAGARLAWKDHWQDVVNLRPNLVAWALGINDNAPNVIADVVAAAEVCWNGVGGATTAPQIVFGPWPNNGGTGVAQTLRDLDTALQTAAEGNGNVVRYWSPIQDGVTFTRADSTHPDNAGHVECMVYFLARLIHTMSGTATP